MKNTTIQYDKKKQIKECYLYTLGNVDEDLQTTYGERRTGYQVYYPESLGINSSDQVLEGNGDDKGNERNFKPRE